MYGRSVPSLNNAPCDDNDDGDIVASAEVLIVMRVPTGTISVYSNFTMSSVAMLDPLSHNLLCSALPLTASTLHVDQTFTKCSNSPPEE